MATRGSIPAKKAGAKSAKKAKGKKTVPKRKVREQAGKTQARVDFATGSDPVVREAWGAAMVADQAEAEVLPHARFRKMARDVLEAAGAAAMVLPDNDDRVLAYGKPADLVKMLRPSVPRHRFVRDTITGMFASARAALRRPKTTVRETR